MGQRGIGSHFIILLKAAVKATEQGNLEVIRCYNLDLITILWLWENPALD